MSMTAVTGRCDEKNPCTFLADQPVRYGDWFDGGTFESNT
jgi:hypothetical protein